MRGIGAQFRELALCAGDLPTRIWSSCARLRARHQQELENLTLTTQPFKTLKFFIFAVIQFLRRTVFYLLSHGGYLMVLCTVGVLIAILLFTIDGPHEKHVEELRQYLQFGLWWVALGVASSIGLGSGLHTFVLYLGPHIALFTIKAVQCGRVDIKSAPYDTIQLKRGPSWLDKDCSEFGPSPFASLHDSRIPLSSILPQIQMEAILWGLGTALGELPPYFISRAASMPGSRLDVMEELDASSSEDNGIISTRLNQIKRWFLSHSQYLNFFTILVLASTVFIICVCNNQLLDWIENELIWVLSFIPGLTSVLPNLVSKLHAMRAKYMATSALMPSNIKKVKNWDLSFTSIWNTIVWLMILNFFVKIVTSTAQRYLKKQQEKELASMQSNESDQSSQ
ncbi:SNARE associated Golgi protein family [Actinidia rufa]|uniref:SNARE associated Golgi protein family n=1 Tax=Actinidia rufa TaxID=165716 RepID=A0A7J0EF50_9ERIC|nr:SNARE associated Golgi protein family [Actinidia rufa]